MNRLTNLFVAGLVLASGVAIAQAAATDPDVIARKDLMRAQAGATKTLGQMAGGALAYDAAAAEAAKATLIATSMEIEAKFTVNAADPESKAKPEIWTNWADYLVKAKALTDAATALDTSSIETIGAGMGAIGGTCKDCHGAYQL